MTEWLFPLVGAAVVFFVAVPLLTLVARGLLANRPAGTDRVDRYAGGLRYMLIVGPTFAPIIWLVSASIHQSESGAPLVTCIVDHLGSELCRDVLFFAAVLVAVVGQGALTRMWRDRTQFGAPRGAARAALVSRVQRVCARNPLLSAFASRIRVVDDGIAPACTRGLLRPRIELDAGLVAELGDEALLAVLLHEAEHALGRDPARFFAAHVALSVNPLGGMLAPELARYHFAREARCDRRAVQAGADPLVLAHSIVAAAAPASLGFGIAALGGHGIAGVRVRVQLLLGYASARPGPARPRPPLGLAGCCVALLAIGPHVAGTGVLDVLHHGIERAALLLGLG